MSIAKLITVFLLFYAAASAKDYVIFSVVQEIPMGHEGEVTKKNYYMNIGEQQGIHSGVHLDVFRNVSRQDPYEGKKRYDYKIKVGVLKVVHSEESSSIGIFSSLNNTPEDPLFEIQNFMIGDLVAVKVD